MTSRGTLAVALLLVAAGLVTYWFPGHGTPSAARSAEPAPAQPAPRAEPSSATPPSGSRATRRAPPPARETVSPQARDEAAPEQSEPDASVEALANPVASQPSPPDPHAGVLRPVLAPRGSEAPAAEPPPAEPPQTEPPQHTARPPRQRQLNVAVLRRWQQPGICARADQARDVHATLMTRFRSSELPGGSRLFLDPRLPQGAELPALGYLQEAEHVLQSKLKLTPGLPDVFLYHDTQLLLAAACTNADVVAYYDGALHVVVTRDDVRESVLHEFTHHALMTEGIIGPAWAQEGIAMHLAQETWWRRPDLLARVAERPFSLMTMETVIPYALETEQAVSFYVQAAAMVACATLDSEHDIAWLVNQLRTQPSGDLLNYELPALADPSAFRACRDGLERQPP